MPESTPFPAAGQVAELERRMQWRALPTLVFLGIIVGLAVVAVFTLVAPRRVEGLPEDSDVRAAQAMARARLSIPTGELRFSSALTGQVIPERDRPDGVDLTAVTEVRALLDRASARSPRDGRIALAQIHLDLARHAYETAERRYRAVIDRGENWPEAHLGLGVTLAQQAGLEPDPLLRRALLLQAIAQFAALQHGSAGYPAALYDRALLLTRVRRGAEARALAAEYRTLDATSPWAARLESAATTAR
jgi:hypothetical protein